nr:protein kinase [Planctomycetota bacterium]
LDEVMEETRALLDASADDAPSSGSGAAARLFAVDLDDGSSAVGTEPTPAAAAPEPVPVPVDPGSRAGRRRYRMNVVRIALQAAEALAFAHARGVLHRDIKPSNIMLDGGGRAWIADFGLCRQEESDGLTRTGDLVGTLRYMAPECFTGVYDVRGDVYGLGLTLYELLCAAPAYDESNRAALIKKVTQESPPRLRSRDPSIPEDLATIVHKAIARDPEMRYPTADALAADLRAYLEGRPISARAPSLAYMLRATIRRHRPLAATIALSIVLLVAGAVFYVVSVKEKEVQARLEHYAANIAAAETALRDGDLPRARRLLAQAPEEFRGWEWQLLQSRLEPGLRTFQSLSPYAAYAVAHSPDGRWFAVGSHFGVHIFDHESGERVHTFKSGAHHLAWSLDSTHIAATHGTYVRVFDWPSRERIFHRGSTEPFHGVCYDPEGAWLYVGSEDCQVHVLDARTFREVAAVSVESKIRDVAVNADGSLLAVGRLDGRLSLFDTDDWRELWTAQASSRGLYEVAFVGDRYVAAAAREGAVHVLHVDGGTLHRVLPHEASVWSVAASPSEPLLATVHGNGMLSLWDVEHNVRPDPWHHGRVVRAVSFHPSGQRLVTASLAGTIREWSPYAGPDVQVFPTEVSSLISLAVQPDGPLVATGEWGGIVRLWNIETSELVRAWPQHVGRVMAVAFSPDGAYLASADTARPPTIQIRRLADGEVVHRLTGPKGAVQALAFTLDGGALMGAGADGVLSVWDPESGARLHEVPISEKLLRTIAVGSQGLLAVAGSDRVIRILDAATWTVRAELAGHEGEVRGLAFHPAGSVLASVSADQTIRLWDATTGETLRTLTEPDPELGLFTEVVQCVAFHPDGTRLATASRNANVVIWDWVRGQAVSTFAMHKSWVNGLEFGNGGRTLVSCSSDRTMRTTGVQSAVERFEPLRRARERRQAVTPIVERLLEAHGGDVTRAIDAAQVDAELSDADREAALRLLHARRDSFTGWKDWAWRVLIQPDADSELLERIHTVGEGYLRFADLRALHHPEAYVIVGAAKHRLKRQPVRGYMDRSITMDPHGTDLHGKAIAFLALAYAREGNLKRAGYWMVRLKSLLALEPSVQTPTVQALHDEAWAVIKAKRGG